MISLDMHQFTKDYYEDGVRKHISGYEDYKWMPTRSIPEALDIQNHFAFLNVNGIKLRDADKTCGKDGYVKMKCAARSAP